jgi:hypothetical protein
LLARKVQAVQTVQGVQIVITLYQITTSCCNTVFLKMKVIGADLRPPLRAVLGSRFVFRPTI